MCIYVCICVFLNFCMRKHALKLSDSPIRSAGFSGFGCGKTGHQSRDCPERKKRREQREQRGRAPLKALENGPAVCPTSGRILCIDMPPIPPPPSVDGDGFRAARKPVKANLASFIVPAKEKKPSSNRARAKETKPQFQLALRLAFSVCPEAARRQETVILQGQ